MSADFLHTPIEFLKGVGPSRAAVLKSELDIRTYEDLLSYYPFRYVDKSQFHKVRDVVSDAIHVQIKGTITHLEEVGQARKKRLVARFTDDSGSIELVWFKGAQWIKSNLKLNQPYVVFGKPSNFHGKISIPHPEIEPENSERIRLGARLKPIYGSGEALTKRGLNSNGFEKIIIGLLKESQGKITEFIPEHILKSLQLMRRAEALRHIHAPESAQQLEQARNRLKFEELFLIQLGLIKNKLTNTKKVKGVIMEQVGDLFNKFYDEVLPFDLTSAQKRVVKEIRNDMKFGYHMNRLLQGDVGSGKTIVALLCSLLALDNGFQVCVMAPTEILAQQHFQSFDKMLRPLDIEVRILTGSTKTAQRNIVHQRLLSGELNILIGTHALLEPVVQFRNLGLAIIDEQHRFGVKQRAKLWIKASIPPHILVMTATPIPRTLAMTMYGDLDVSVIDELPPGRKPVTTTHRTDASRDRVFGFMESEIKKGRQVYMVYPLINESEAMDYKDLMDGYESVVRRFPLPEYRISIVHGKMKPEDKAHEMDLFIQGKTHIMVSTTVIEVGVDVPNASMMIIESAERFGLSQLHQLRGRVGRGADQSYCILMTGHKLSAEAKVRLETMVRTNDGFELAEVDLQLRGPGDVMGTQQSGILDLKLADLGKDQKILKVARHFSEELMGEDFDLEQEENTPLRKKLEVYFKQKQGWALIS